MKDFSLSNPYTLGGAFPNTAAKTADAGQANGTAFNKALVDEIMGFFQAALVKGNRTPNGVSDTSVSSQILNSIVEYTRKPDQRKFKFTQYFFNTTTQLSHPATEFKMSFFWDGQTAKYVFDENYFSAPVANTNTVILVPTNQEILSTTGDRWSGVCTVNNTGNFIATDIDIAIVLSTGYGISPAQPVIKITFPNLGIPLANCVFTLRNGFSFHPVPLSDWA